jgi:hypothetical protein
MWKVERPKRDWTSGDRLTQLEKKRPCNKNKTIMLASQIRVEAELGFVARVFGEDMVTQG